jgi:6-phosphogluconolactonase
VRQGRRWALRRSVKCVPLLVLCVGVSASVATAAPFVYVTNANSANVSQYDATAGVLAPLSPATVSTVNAPLGVGASRGGASIYVTTPEPAAVLQYSVAADGALSLKSSAVIPARALPGALAISPDGQSIYIINSGGNQALLQYSVGADGALTPKSPASVATGPGPTRVAVSPDSRSVYVTNTVSGLSTVSQYTASADGTLTPKSPPTVPLDEDPFVQPVGIAVSPDGRSVYVANAAAVGPGTLFQFTVAVDGTLSPNSPPTVLAAGQPFEIAISPDGHSVYATNGARAGAVLQYTVRADGTLTPKSPFGVAAGSFPLGIAINGDGNSVYAANAGDDTVSQYSVGAEGALSPRSPATVAAGINPIEIAVTPAPTPTPRLPTAKEQCKRGGWRTFSPFKNQGDCVAFVATQGKNPPG